MNVILIVGPSGSGKDTLLRSAKKHFGPTDKLSFVRRYITRPPSKDEDNFYLDQEGFLTLKECQFFVSTWQAHNNYYGIARHALTSDKKHYGLLCSISRRAVTDFEEKFANTTTIHVSAREDILLERLKERGRENREDIEKRLHRATRKVEARELITFDNSDPLDKTIPSFLSLLDELANKRTLPVDIK